MFGLGQAKEALGLLGYVPETDQSGAFADDVQKVAMLAAGGIGLMFNGT